MDSHVACLAEDVLAHLSVNSVHVVALGVLEFEAGLSYIGGLYVEKPQRALFI